MWTKKTLARNGNLVQTKTRPRINYEWIGITIYEKNPIQKVKKTSKNQSETAACEQKTTSARNGNWVQTKNQAWIELRMDWDNHLGEKNPIQKIEKKQ